MYVSLVRHQDMCLYTFPSVRKCALQLANLEFWEKKRFVLFMCPTKHGMRSSRGYTCSMISKEDMIVEGRHEHAINKPTPIEHVICVCFPAYVVSGGGGRRQGPGLPAVRGHVANNVRTTYSYIQ